MFHRVVVIACLVALHPATLHLTALHANEPMQPCVIHEWGTFTVLQDEAGNTLQGVNINEESLPRFTHRLYPALIKESGSRMPNLGRRSKGLPSSFSAATMRMETPIIYIYPPNGEPTNIDVRVRFQGGWISEWFPNAEVDSPGFDHTRRDLGQLNRKSQGSIAWNDLTINSDKAIPETKQHVWLAPRAVQTPTLHTALGEAENYLFYRGVANIEAPLRVEQTKDEQGYAILRNQSVGDWEESLEFKRMWLVDIVESGAAAYRNIDLTVQREGSQALSTTQSKFDSEEYSTARLSDLKAEMKSQLIADGLFEDEADAMLRTWELSYFKSPGTRLFFTLPRAWTDRILPLEVSREANIERVMIGRIELVTERQRKLLEVISSSTISNPDWFWKHLPKLTTTAQTALWTSLANGSKEITDFDFDVPDDYQAYLQLGRFRESIVANAGRHEDAVHLREFARNYQIATR